MIDDPALDDQPERATVVPDPSFDHLLRLSDDTGVFEHVRGATPDRAQGYRVDDAACGLVALCREPDPGPDLLRLTELYLAFVVHAQEPDGSFHNRLAFDRRWRDEPDVGEAWGRALWGLGAVVAHGPLPWLREAALACFEAGARRRCRLARPMAFAALGAAEVLTVQPRHVGARRLLGLVGDVIGPSTFDERWPWPEPRLGRANAVLAEALIVAGRHLRRPAATTRGLRLLDWLLAHETVAGHLSVTPPDGGGPAQHRPAFDQRPVEPAALADACATAFAITGEARWRAGVQLCVGWFLGDNDHRAVLRDPATGGCHDGLTVAGRSPNQSAESTIALVTTLQHGRGAG